MPKFLWLAVAAAACGGSSKPAAVEPGPLPTAPTAANTPIATGSLLKGPPVARKDATVDTFFGETVADPYRWLEGNGDDVKTWLKSENEYTASILDALPTLDVLRADITKIVRAPQTRWFKVSPTKTLVWAARQLADDDSASVVAMADPAKPENAVVVFKPDASKHAAMDFFLVAPKGDIAGVVISVDGSEAGDLYFYDAKGKQIGEPIKNVERPTSGGDIAWLPDSSGVYYTRYPSGSEKHADEADYWQQLWFHSMKTGQDVPVLADELQKSEQITVQTDAKGNVLANVQHGDSGPIRHYVRKAGAKGAFTLLADEKEKVALSVLGSQNDVWLVSRKDAPMGRVLHVNIGQPITAAKVVVPASDESIETDYYAKDGLVEVNGAIYVQYEAGGPERIHAFTRAGKALPALPLPDVASVILPRAWKGGYITAATTYTQPLTYYYVTPKGAAESLPLGIKATVDMSQYDVSRDTATSKDGTKIPYTLVQKKGAVHDGTMPCIVNGYGGFDIAMAPSFLESRTPLLSHGVCMVIANLRGGSEYGEPWHEAGMLTRKQNVFDDFTAVLTDVATKKITSADRIAIIGGSNGGLLMGTTLTQHAELVKAVVSYVGIYDSLRYELTPNGATNTNEYGSVKDPEQFKALRAYSPYHNIPAGKALPATLLVAGDNDGRVAPWMSRKFAAALQAAQTGSAPILLKTSSTAGHGFGTGRSEQIEEDARVYAFILAQLGVK
ncbi:MAG TPA: prolyl oligopeptidase family serine peptidase [Kofleriaceae bacterium]|jgi:prolyl oligopeptidase